MRLNLGVYENTSSKFTIERCDVLINSNETLLVYPQWDAKPTQWRNILKQQNPRLAWVLS